MQTTTKHIPFKFGSWISSIIVLVVFSCITGILMYYGITEDQKWATAIGLFFILAIYLNPSLNAYNLGGVDRKLEGIQHPYFWIILIINLFFGATLLGWIIAHIWAHAPGTITIPVRDTIQSNQQNNTSNSTKDIGNLESQLSKIDELFKKGVITEDEYKSKRKIIIDNA